MTKSPPNLDAFGVKTPPPSLKAANAALRIPRFFFDRRDHELIRIINTVGAKDRDLDYFRR